MQIDSTPGVKDLDGTSCAAIDPVMEFDDVAGRLTYDSANVTIADTKEHGLHLTSSASWATKNFDNPWRSH